MLTKTQLFLDCLDLKYCSSLSLVALCSNMSYIELLQDSSTCYTLLAYLCHIYSEASSPSTMLCKAGTYLTYYNFFAEKLHKVTSNEFVHRKN